MKKRLRPAVSLTPSSMGSKAFEEAQCYKVKITDLNKKVDATCHAVHLGLRGGVTPKRPHHE